MKLVDNWKDGWKWVSTQCMALSVAVLGAWDVIPEEWKSALPAGGAKSLVLGLLLIGIVGRFIQQAKPE